MNYLGDYAEDSTVYIYFTTHDADSGAPIAPSSAFENDDVAIYKNGSATQKATVNGITMTSPFDSVTGLHLLAIDTNNDTGDVGFWATGGEYSVVLNPDETVDGSAVAKVIGTFSIERSGGAIELLTNATYGLSALETLVDDLESRLGTPADLGSGATVAANLTDIEAQTDDIGAAGAGLTAIPWNAAWDAEVESECLEAIQSYDPPTHTELINEINDVQTDIAGLNDPSAADIADAVWDETSAGHTDAGKAGQQLWTDIDDILADTNELQTDDVPGLIAALNNVSAAEVVDEWETQSQADPTGFHVNVLEVNGTAQTANDNGADINDILTDTNELQTDWTNGGRLDTIVDDILADTNELQLDDVPGLIAALNDISVADILAGNIEGAVDLENVLQVVLAFCAGKCNGGGTATINFRDQADSKNRIQLTVDGDGDRSATSLDLD
jgi:hypothetical protein